MSYASLIYGARVRRADFFVKVGSRVVCRNGHPQTAANWVFCPVCGKRYINEDVVEPSSHVARMMHSAFISQFDDWWDQARGDLLDGDPGIMIWRVDPIQREDDYLRIEKDWDSATFALGVRVIEISSSDEGRGFRVPTIRDLQEVDARLRTEFPRWGLPNDAECHLYPVLMTRR